MDLMSPLPELTPAQVVALDAAGLGQAWCQARFCETLATLVLASWEPSSSSAKVRLQLPLPGARAAARGYGVSGFLDFPELTKENWAPNPEQVARQSEFFARLEAGLPVLPLAHIPFGPEGQPLVFKGNQDQWAGWPARFRARQLPALEAWLTSQALGQVLPAGAPPSASESARPRI